MKRFFAQMNGFTLLELIIAVAIFLVLTTIAGNIIFSAVRFQRVASDAQDLEDNLRGAFEIMGREIRLAAKDDQGTCVASRTNYEFTAESLKFLTDRNTCIRYSRDSAGRIQKENLSPALPTEQLTADSVEVLSLRFDVLGESGDDKEQPRVVIRVSARNKGSAEPLLKLQTTLTQRELDVQ